MTKGVQPVEAMAAELAKEKQRKPRIYKEIANEARAEAISASIDFQMQMLSETIANGKVNLADTETVKERAAAFLKACSLASVMPTFENFCLSLGYGRDRVYKYLAANQGSPTQEFISLLQNSFAAVLQNAALNRNCDTIMSIFLLKNSNLGFNDKSEVEIVTAKFDEGISAEDIIKRYETLPDD